MINCNYAKALEEAGKIIEVLSQPKVPSFYSHFPC